MVYARHLLLKTVREFFYSRGYTEVETPYLTETSPTDPYIDPLAAFVGSTGPFYLHTSPEMGMKKLLAFGNDRIFQICKVFRVEEFEEQHNTEFTMVEWYRPGSYTDAMEETEGVVRTVDKVLNGDSELYTDGVWPVRLLADLFREISGFDPLPLSREDLFSRMRTRGFCGLSDDDSWEDLFFKLLIQEVEPHLLASAEGPYFMKDWPASLTAMARKKDDFTVERFELYMRGLEIANGYSELLDPEEQRVRMERDNEKRLLLGKPVFPLDEAFLDAIGRIAGPVTGCSVGVDRLLMALLNRKTIGEVLPDRLVP